MNRKQTKGKTMTKKMYQRSDREIRLLGQKPKTLDQVKPACGDLSEQQDKATPRPWFVVQCLPDTIPTFEGETVTVIVDGQNRNVLNGKPLLEHAANAALIIKAVNSYAALVSVAEHIRAMADDAYLVGHPEWNEIVKEVAALDAIRKA
jgi:hypothetical protein